MSERGEDRSTEESERPGTLERVLFARVELWVVIALFLLTGLAVIGFGAAVLDAARDKGRFGSISQAALAIAEIPKTAKSLIKPETPFRVWGSYRSDAQPAGWRFPGGTVSTLRGYILLSRYDGTERRPKLELVSLPSMRTVYSWSLDIGKIVRGSFVSRFADPTNWTNKRSRIVHPLLLNNGDLIVKDFYTPLFRVNSCGKVVWKIDDAVFHHSTEVDADGNMWIPSIIEESAIPGLSSDFLDDAITQIDQSGKVLFRKSVAEILIRHGLANWLFSNAMYNSDSVHLNDIQPVLNDGNFWKRGDLFVSMRNVSAIMLYRPRTDEVLWIRRGPWVSQHDVDVLDDHRIGIYDNGVEDRGSEPFFPANSEIMVYDFATNRVTLPAHEAMRKQGIRTWMEGSFTQLPEGSIMVGDTMAGRLFVFGSDQTVKAEYINRGMDGWLYHLGWSRYIDQATGDVIARNLKKVKCNA